jgi:hypothetical protein
MEQPIDGFWSAGATRVVAIARMASTVNAPVASGKNWGKRWLRLLFPAQLELPT